jgi:hypothetical protein
MHIKPRCQWGLSGIGMKYSPHPSYDFGAQRVATLALLTFTALLASRSCGIVIVKFSGHAVALRSSPTVFGNGWTSASASTRILSGKPPRATWSAAMPLGL